MKKFVFFLFLLVGFQLQAQDRYFLEVNVTWTNSDDCYYFCPFEGPRIDTPGCPYDGCTIIEEFDGRLIIRDAANNVLDTMDGDRDSFTLFYQGSFSVPPARIDYVADFCEIVDLDEATSCDTQTKTVNITPGAVCYSGSSFFDELNVEFLDTKQVLDNPSDTNLDSCGQIVFSADNDCNGYRYRWLYSIDGGSNFNTAATSTGSSNATRNVINYVESDTETFIVKAEISSDNGATYTSETNEIVYDVIQCSPELEDVLPNNTSCAGINDGNVTLVFGSDIDVNSDMRYFIYQSNGAATPEEAFDAFNDDTNSTFPPQSFAEVRLGSLLDNGDGTFSGSSTLGDIISGDGSLEANEYYVLYQEVDYSTTPVTVKSGELTPSFFEINEPTEVEITSLGITQPDCSVDRGEVTVIAQGGGYEPNPNAALQYGFSLNGGLIDWSNPTATFSNLGSGDYLFYARTPTSCISSASQQVTISVPTALTLSNPTASLASNNTTEDAVISVEFGGGTPSTTAPFYSFELSRENAPNVFDLVTVPSQDIIFTGNRIEYRNLGIGIYRIKITDANFCELTTQASGSGDIEVTTAPIPILGAPTVTPISCNDANDGTITVNATYPTPTTFFYELRRDGTTEITSGNVVSSGTSPSQQGISISTVSPGTYTLFVRASVGDFSSIAIPEIINPDPITVSITAVPFSCFDSTDGAITVVASGATNYDYRLSTDVFNWLPLTGNTIPVSNPNFYEVTLRDRNNTSCVSTISNQIEVTRPEEISILETIFPATTNGGFQGSISLTITEGTPFTLPDNPYTITWTKQTTGPAAPFTDTDLLTPYEIIGLEAATYRAIITDANGCNPNPNPVEIIITEPGPLSIEPLTGTDTCNGLNTGTITATVQGTGDIIFQFQQPLGNTVYTITTADRTVTAPNLGAGIYALRIEEVVGGNSITTLPADYFTITELAAISATATPNDASCASPNSGTITVTGVTGGSPFLTGPNAATGYEYKIDDIFDSFQSNTTFSNLAPRAYLVTVRDALGCEYTETVTVGAGELPILDTANSVPTSPSTIGGSDGSITLNFENIDISGYTYLWTGPGVTGNTSQNLTALIMGNYSVEITASVGCSITENFTVTDPDPQDIVPTETNINCKGDATGAIDVTIVGETPISYQWTFADDSAIVTSDGTTSEDISGLLAGTYVLTITYVDTSTFRSRDIEITEPTDEITATPTTITNVTCNGGNDGSITITANGGTGTLLYSLDGATPQASNTFNNLQSGAFIITVIDDNLCTLPLAAIAIGQPDIVTFINNQTTVTPVSTNGGSDGSITAVLEGGSTPYFYEWSVLNGAVLPETSNTLSNLTQGTYVLRVSNTNAFAADGCFIEREFTVPEPGPLSISNIVEVNVDCRGNASGSIGTTVIGEGTITYAWTLEGGAPIPVSNGTDNPNIAGIAAGVYVLTVTDDNETISSNPITITEPTEILEITNVTPTDVICFGGDTGTITITATGGTAPYEYSIDDGTNYQNLNEFTGLATGSYTIRVRDFNDCTFVRPGTTFINQPQELILTVTNQQSLSAAGASDGAITVAVTGGTGTITYDWAGPGTFDRTSPSISGLVGGVYTVTVSDALGCPLISGPITIAEPGVLSVTSNQTVFLSCNGDDFGEIEAFPNGGVSPYTYQWFQIIGGNNNVLTEDTNIIADLSAGEYFVRITDANGISADGNMVTITEPTSIQITLDSKIDVLCANEETGALNIIVSGGTPPYTYVWNSGQSTQDISNIPAGSYTIEIGDSNTCFTDATFEITAPADALQIANASITDVSSYQGSDGSISLDISGGATPYSINWTRLSDNTSAGNQSSISNLLADSYQVLITDANGCDVTETYEIEQPDIVEETIVPPTCSGESNGSISVLVNEGNGTFGYSWSTGATTNSIANLAAGTYSVTITGFEDGPITRTYELEDPLPLEVNLGTDRVLCADQILELDVTVDDETATYLWSSDTGFTSTSPNVTLTESGNYTVVVTSQTGCTAEGNILVDISTEEIDAEFALSSQVFEGEDVVAVDISFPLPESIVWQVPEGATVVTQNSDELVLIFENEGEYEIGITTTRGDCIASKTKKVFVVKRDPLTDEDKTQADNVVEDFIVYPNPTTGRFTADVSITEPGNISIKVFNFANNAMMASERGRGETSYSIPFDISGMPSGVYAVLLETPYGTSLRKIIVL